MSTPVADDPFPTRPGSPDDAAEAVDTAVLGKNHGVKEGDQLGSYELLEPLGRGGMGMVFRARHLRLKKEFALKLLAPRFARDRGAASRFEREIEALGRLEHLHLVRASDAGVENGIPFVVMELLDGMDLAQLTENRGTWPIAEACEAARQAARGLQHAHERGLVHRDVKPSNLWLTSDGIVKVLDLGLARLGAPRGGGSAMTQVGMWMGTPDYIAPEQILDSHSIDIRADLYSLGCTLFHLLSGEPPFGATSHPELRDKNEAHLRKAPPDVRQRRPDVPGALAAVLNRLLAKQPQDRYATPAEAAAALAPFAQNARLQALFTDDEVARVAVAPTQNNGSLTLPITPSVSLAQRNRGVPALGWIAAVLIVVGIALVPLLINPDSGQPSSSAAHPTPKEPEPKSWKKTRNPGPRPVSQPSSVYNPGPAFHPPPQPAPTPPPQLGPPPPPGMGPPYGPGPHPGPGPGPFPGPGPGPRPRP